MPSIKRPEDILQEALDEATKLNFPHFNKLDWLPVWTQSEPAKLKDNIEDPPKISAKPLNCVNLPAFKQRIEALRTKYAKQLDHVQAGRPVEFPEQLEEGNKLQKMPHPGADFSHVDKGAFTGDGSNKFQQAMDALKIVRDLAKKDGELNQAIQLALKPLGHAEELLNADPKGMQRLKLVFEWTLCQITTLFGEINAALELGHPGGMDKYNETRKRYIALLEDLDDAEPETRSNLKPGERGYGRAVKWCYFIPLIHDGKIKGAKVMAKWNPHMSSSGVPIPHS